MAMGFVVREVVGGKVRGFVLIVPSSDLKDYEIIADGGWCVGAARKLFGILFDDLKMPRVSARCDARHHRTSASCAGSVSSRKAAAGSATASKS